MNQNGETKAPAATGMHTIRCEKHRKWILSVNEGAPCWDCEREQQLRAAEPRAVAS